MTNGAMISLVIGAWLLVIRGALVIGIGDRSFAAHWPLVLGYWSFAAHWSLVLGDRSFVAHWPLVLGYWSFGAPRGYNRIADQSVQGMLAGLETVA